MRREDKDITTVQGPGVIAHGVNCQNTMGSGVAKALYSKWPTVKTKYHESSNLMGLGMVHSIEVEPDLWVSNCFTQEYYGRDGGRYASPDAIEEALEQVIGFVQSRSLPPVIHLPLIGCGLGGLNFETDVEPILQRLEKKSDVEFVVCNV